MIGPRVVLLIDLFFLFLFFEKEKKKKYFISLTLLVHRLHHSLVSVSYLTLLLIAECLKEGLLVCDDNGNQAINEVNEHGYVHGLD